MEYNFSGKLTLSDYNDFGKYHRNKFRKYMFFSIILFLGVVILLIVLLQNKSEIRPAIINLIFLSIIFFTIFVSIIMKYKFNRLHNSIKFLTELRNYSITDNKITVNSDTENYIITKNRIDTITYDKESIYINLNQTITTYIIKDRFFNNEAEFEELKIFIKENYDECGI
jgi:hypothetical protein